MGHFKLVRNGSSQLGFGSGQVNSYFSHEFFFKGKQHVFVIWKVIQQIT